MDTNDLTALMKELWEEEKQDSNLERFLVLSHDAYQEEKLLEDLIDWDALKTSHSQEEFGRNCNLALDMLKRMNQGKAASKNTGSRPGVRFFRNDERFRTFCYDALEQLQNKARGLLKNEEKPLRSRKDRERESEKESHEDIQGIYDDIKEIREQAQEYAQSALSLQKRTAELKLEALNAQHAAESIIPNMLTTLGVFIAIVVAVVGCYLSLIFNKHQDPGFPVLNLSVCLLMGHILVSIIFLLIYLISKLTSHTMACYCHVGSQMDCSMCPQKIRSACKLPNRIWLRYPYVVLLNGVFLLSYAALGLWHFLRSYLGEEIDQMFKEGWQPVMKCAVAMVVMTILIVGVSFLFMTPGRKLRKARSEQSKDTGLTMVQMELKHQVSKLVERMDSMEALYEGRRYAERRTSGSQDVE
mgnify:FL=1